MRREEITEKICVFEETHHVEQYTIDGLCVWPFLRLRISFDLFFKHLRSDALMDKREVTPTSQQQLGRLPKIAREIWRLAKLQIRCSEAANRLFNGQKETPPGQESQVVLITDANRLIPAGRTYIHTVADPLLELFEAHNLSIAIWELGEFKGNREKSPILLSRHVDKVVVETKMLGYLVRLFRPQQEEPYWFADVQKWLLDVFGLNYGWPMIYERFRQIMGWSRLFESWLRRCNCRLLFLDCWYIPPALAAIHAAKRVGIPSVDYQHGSQGEGHFAYASWRKRPSGGFPFMPDYYWSWGERDAKALVDRNPNVISKAQVLVGGNTWLNRWKAPCKSYMNDWIESARLLGKDFKKVVLVSLQYNLTSYGPLLPAISRSPGDWLWLIRLHRQMEDDLSALEREFFQTGHKGINIREATRFPLYALFQASENHVTWCSTTAMEALAFDVPTTLLHPTGHRIYKDFVDKGVMNYAAEPEALLQLIKAQEKIPRNRCRAVSEDIFAPNARTQDVINRLLRIMGSGNDA